MSNNKLDFDHKALKFYKAITDAYKDIVDTHDVSTTPESAEEDITEEFTAMLVAIGVFYRKMVDEDSDLIGFTHVLNGLAIQHIYTKDAIGTENE